MRTAIRLLWLRLPRIPNGTERGHSSGNRAELCAVLAIALLTTACPSDRPPPDQPLLTLSTTTLRLATPRDTVALSLELALSPDEQRLGLMERLHLAENAGMLFVYDSTQPGTAGFWMYRTRIPLDIAFLDSLGRVRSIRSMVPCPTTLLEGCPTYTPDVPYRYALEVNAGFFRAHGVDTGAVLFVRDLPKRTR